MVTVNPCESAPPVANAGVDQTAETQPGTPVAIALDGSLSQADDYCYGVELTNYSWVVTAKPDWAEDPVINNADQVVASVDLVSFGDYQFALTVQDSAGTENGRIDTSTDQVIVGLGPVLTCADTLDVKVVDAITLAPIEGAAVTVVDAASNVAQPVITDAMGLAQFTGLTSGARESITVSEGTLVAALPYSGDGTQRSKYETTQVINLCTEDITIPLQMTDAGKSAQATGSVIGKIPRSMYEMLPHSWKCAGACATNNDCDDTYYCELEDDRCKNRCTPKSLLPFFSLGDPNISGQLRAVWLFPVTTPENFAEFSIAQMLAPPSHEGEVLPGNFITDDYFMNGLAPSLGYNIWGNECTRPSDCPTPVNPQPGEYSCEQDPGGDYRCKDLSPMRSFRVTIPAGEQQIVLVAGIVDVSLTDLLPALLPFLSGGGDDVELDYVGMMGAYKMQTLQLCVVDVNITAIQELDITNATQKIIVMHNLVDPNRQIFI